MFLAALEEDGLARVFEDDVGQRVFAFDLFLDLVVEVVVGVLGFPVAARQVEEVEERAVGEDGLTVDLVRPFGNEHPAVRLAVVASSWLKVVSVAPSWAALWALNEVPATGRMNERIVAALREAAQAES
jgi:hypothetical protein